MAKKRPTAESTQAVVAEAEAALGAEAVLEEESLEGLPQLPTGIPLLNLACSDKIDGGFPAGRFVRYFGGSGSGKTESMLLALAEACRPTSFFKDHKKKYKDAEGGMLFDVGPRYGRRLASSLIVEHPESVEDVFFDLYREMSEGPVVSVIDSYDALSSKQEQKKGEERRKAAVTGAKIAGDMSDGKAKQFSSQFRQVGPLVRKTNSIVFGISQVRDDLESMFGGETTSGGRALKFYSSMEIHTSESKAIPKTINGNERKIGKWVRFKIVKNRLTGNDIEIRIPHYPSIGFDATGASVHWLIAEKVWKETDGRIEALPEFGMEKSMLTNKFIQMVDADPKLLAKLNTTLSGAWAAMREAMRVVRRNTYD